MKAVEEYQEKSEAKNVMEFEHITVLGAGLMGRQIAVQTALSGYETVCCDIAGAVTDSARAFSDSLFAGRVEKGRLTEAQRQTAQSRLTFTTDMKAAAAKADLVIEAVSDVVGTKKKALAAFDQYAKEEVVYASNSSYIVSSRFCDAVRHPERMLNLHFFNPALVMELVEVVPGPHTAHETTQAVYHFAETIGKSPVLVKKEIYGFIVNRIFAAMTSEACYLVDLEIAAPEDIDKAVKGGLGHKMGPLELLDMTGLDLEYNIYMEKFRASGNKEDRPAACITEHYMKGEYGRKTGKGFYEYQQSGEK